MAYILSIETATDVCSVAVSKGKDLLSEKTLGEGMRHSAALTSLIKEAVAESGISMSLLSAVAISDGPGSYTGLRVGTSTGKAICYGLDIPLIAIPTLEALATAMDDDTQEIVLPTIDARRMEAYAAIYKSGNLVKQVHSIIWSTEIAKSLSELYGSLLICGTGVAKASAYFERFENVKISPSLCSAANLVTIAAERFAAGSFVNTAYHNPFYFKSPNITTPKGSF